VPSHHGLRLHDYNGAQHRRAQPIQPNEDQPIDERQSRPRWHTAAQNVQLMPKNHDISLKSPLGPEQRDHQACQELQTIDHPAADYPIRGRKPLRMKFSAGTGAAYFMLKYSRAVDFLGQSIALNPSPTPTYFYLIAALALTGHQDEARQALTNYLSQPGARIKTIAMWKRQNNQKNPRFLAFRERCYDGLRKAGMPEQ
jgi:hypothetical protein